VRWIRRAVDSPRGGLQLPQILIVLLGVYPMRLSKLHIPTLREPPKDAEVISHQLLVRAGFIRRAAAGVYSFLPLAVRSMEKVKRIIREELDEAGAQEVLMPVAVPADLWLESNRWNEYGPELLRFKDRKGADFCIGPTHEEAIVDLVRNDINSYKQLPVNFYQIQTKFRDEMRPRAGLMRGREFMMKDAYSFDADAEGARASYESMFAAYSRIFSRLGLDFRAVEADSGNIGGSLSHEFQVLADSGEDAIVSCTDCDYAANIEAAPIAPESPLTVPADAPAMQKVATPDCKTIAAVCALLGEPTNKSIKAVLFDADGVPLVAFVRGDRALNEVKLKRISGATDLHIADGEWFAKATGLPPGYIGPVGLDNVEVASGEEGAAPVPLRVFIDHEVRAVSGAAAGANEAGYHLTNVFADRDIPGAQWADLRMAILGDLCPRCGGALRTFRGIEVGHVFYLGTKYSKAMNATFLNVNGKPQVFEMGCYGIGVSRILSAAVEQNHDERGICWPVALAPFEVVIVVLARDEVGLEVAETLYNDLRSRGIEVVIDDRKQRPGVKFKDAELVGYPVCVTVGRNAGEGMIEAKLRKDGVKLDVPVAGLVDKLSTTIIAARAGAELSL
jgi:prolyl-tRNA synthetase